MIADKNIIYNSGADMWHDTISQYGETEARKICTNYLHMQVFNKDPEEDKFCRELHAAMRDTFVKNVSKSSILTN